jgi:16S rRNA (uracil1498-N3)-methyltransferase
MLSPMTNDNSNDLPEFARIRLFVAGDLGAGAHLTLTADQSHYLRHVLRRSEGQTLRVFNGRDGEWAARIETPARQTTVAIEGRRRAQDVVPDVTLAFAPIKKSPMEYLVEKATELGVKRLQPVITARTQVHRVNLDRLRAHAIEAAEQSWRLSVPEIAEPVDLNIFMDGWGGDPLLYCDERKVTGERDGALDTLAGAAHRLGPWAILIGPEGGFAPEEQAALEALPNAVTISLGPRIVRAETAAVMALTLWQAALGDLTGPAG